MWSGCCRADVVESSWLVRAASHGLERTLPTRNSSSRVEPSDAEKQHDAAENPEQNRTQKRPKIPPKSSPNEAKIDPKWVPGALRDPPGGLGAPRSAPGPPQRRPEGPRERPLSVPGAAQNPPRAPQGGQRDPKRRPKAARDPQNRPKTPSEHSSGRSSFENLFRDRFRTIFRSKPLPKSQYKTGAHSARKWHRRWLRRPLRNSVSYRKNQCPGPVRPKQGLREPRRKSAEKRAENSSETDLARRCPTKLFRRRFRPENRPNIDQIRSKADPGPPGRPPGATEAFERPGRSEKVRSGGPPGRSGDAPGGLAGRGVRTCPIGPGRSPLNPDAYSG